jgi:acetate kinase
MSVDLLLTFNAGSSTVKLGLFELSASGARRIAKGEIDFRKAPLSFRVTEGPVTLDVELTARPSDDLHEVMDETFGWLAKHFDMSCVTAVGHRVVHGGDSFAGPVRIEDATIAAIDALTILAPLHQPQSVRLIRAIRHLRPGLAQSASFDTAFQPRRRATVRHSARAA